MGSGDLGSTNAPDSVRGGAARAPDVAQVRERLADVIEKMKAGGVWDVPRPPDGAFAEMGAFGERTMTFEHWLRWVFVPAVEERVEHGGPWPDVSRVGSRAAREAASHEGLAIVVGALEAFDALFVPTSRPSLTGARAEEALANRGDALVAEGHEEEAVALVTEAIEGPLGATAHNWLAWYYGQKNPDPPKAVEHGERAVALRPGWGAAHLNLAWALEQAAEPARAYGSYLDALACGNAHDESFAEERAMTLLSEAISRGDEPPRLTPGSPAYRRTASVDRVLQLLVAELRTLPDLGSQAWFSRVGAPAPEGDVPFGWLGTAARGRVFVHALAHDLGLGVAVEVLARRGRTVVLRSVAVRGEDVLEAARTVAEWVRAGAMSHVASVTPLDASVLVLDALRAALPGWRLRLTGGSDHLLAERPASMTVVQRRFPAQLGATFEATSDGGLLVRLMPEGMDAPRPEPFEIATLDELRQASPDLVDATARAFAALEEFRARPLPVASAARSVLKALVAAGLGDGVWEAAVVEDGYPWRWPLAQLRLRSGDVERTIGRIDESADGCRIDVDGMGWLVASPEELAATTAAIVARVKHTLGG